MAFLLTRSFRWVIFVILAFTLVQYALRSKSFTFSPKEFRAIATKHSGAASSTAAARGVATDLRKKYGVHVLPDAELKWLSLTAGGLQARLLLLHASHTEYMALIAAPSVTEGSSGLHWMNQSCTVMSGSVRMSKNDGLNTAMQTFGSGENLRLGMFETAALWLDAETSMLCYGRGVVVASAPYLTLGAVLSAADPLSPAQLYFFYTRAMLRESLIWVQETFEHYKKQYF